MPLRVSVLDREFALPAPVAEPRTGAWPMLSDVHRAHLERQGTVTNLVGPGLFLQDDATPPDDPRFEVFHVERHTVDGRARRAVGLRLR